MNDTLQQEQQIQEQKGTQNPVLRTLAHIVSYVFHPVFMPLAMTFVLMKLSPNSFLGFDEKRLGLILVSIGGQTIFFPLFVVLLLKLLGFVDSFYLRTQKERIIPLIGTIIFYWWASRVAIGNNYPDLLQILLRGAYWAVIVLFMVNIFLKVSMHTMAAGGMLGILTVLLIMSSVQMVVPLFVAIIIAGAIGTARMLLGAHNAPQIFLGYVLGILVQLAAYMYVV